MAGARVQVTMAPYSGAYAGQPFVTTRTYLGWGTWKPVGPVNSTNTRPDERVVLSVNEAVATTPV
jgi:hypothetical protein